MDIFTNNTNTNNKISYTAIILSAMYMTQYANALTPADEIIENQASATYIDANNNQYEAQSNESRIQVRQVFSATINTDRSKNGAAGQTVYFSHLLTNTGNGVDSYHFSVAQDVSLGDTGDCLSLSVVQDGPINGSGNGQSDAGELVLHDGSNELAILTLNAGDFVNLAVSCQTPGTASDGDSFGVTLTSQAEQGSGAAQTNSVIDIGSNADNTNDTNEDLVTVLGGAILNIRKDAVFSNNATPNDGTDDNITYTVTVTNTGSAPAYNVEVQDVVDLDAHGSTLVGVSAITIISSNGNFIDQVGVFDEGANTIDTTEGFGAIATTDANGDGGNGDIGVRTHDDVLNANTTVSFSYRVSVNSAILNINDLIPNTATIVGDNNDDGDTVDLGEQVDSNTTLVSIPQLFAVAADDVGVNPSPNVNDGGDDDNVANDMQTVDAIASGGTIIFTHTITNNGNGDDVFELDIGANNFPAGTVFSFFNAANNLPLIDTNSADLRDTGVLAPGEQLNIIVRAQMPSNTNAGAFSGTLNATSAQAKESGLTITDPTGFQVQSILAPSADLANDTIVGDPAPDNDANADQHDYLAVDENSATSPIVTQSANPGDTIIFPLTVQNDTGASDSFQLRAGGSIAADQQTLGALPSGWSVVFVDQNGTPINATPSIPAGGFVQISALVSVSNLATEALSDYRNFINNSFTGSGGDFIDGGVSFAGASAADGDGDYGIFFKIESANTGAFDITLDAVDVSPIEQVSITPDNSGQIQPGGSIDYRHVLANTGNTVESFNLLGANSEAGFGNALLVDTNGDNIADKAFSALIIGIDSITVEDANGALMAQLVQAGPNGEPIVTLNPGDKLALTAREFAPSNANNGDRDTLLISATYNINNIDGVQTVISVQDITDVILGQLRLVKTNAPDANCDGIPDVNLAQVQPSSITVAPGECIVWQIVAINEGAAAVLQVAIFDAEPDFTQFKLDLPPVGGTAAPDNNLRSCLGNAGLSPAGSGCLNGTINDEGRLHTVADDNESSTHADGQSAKHQGGDVTFFVGTGGSGTQGGSIAPGDSVTVRFIVEVQ